MHHRICMSFYGIHAFSSNYKPRAMNLQSPVVFQCLSEILARIAFGCGAFPLVLKLPVFSGATHFLVLKLPVFSGATHFFGVEAASSIWCNTSSLVLKLPVSSGATSFSLVLKLQVLSGATALL